MTERDESGRRPAGDRARLASGLALLALLVAVGGIAFGAGGASAGDNVAVLEFEPEELSVEPGETADVDVTLRSHGEFTDVGVAEIELRLDYPTEYLTVTHIEPGDWFDEAPENDPLGEGQAETEVRERIEYADENGAALFEQSLAAPEFGVIGTATVATVTVEVREDAEAATAQLSAEGTRVFPTRSQYSQPTSVTPAAFRVDGGGDVVEPSFVDEPFADTGDDEVGDSPQETESGSDGTDDGSSDDDGEASDGGSADDDDGGDDGDDGDDETDDDAAAPLGAVVLGVLFAALVGRRRARH